MVVVVGQVATHPSVHGHVLLHDLLPLDVLVVDQLLDDHVGVRAHALHRLAEPNASLLRVEVLLEPDGSLGKRNTG